MNTELEMLFYFFTLSVYLIKRSPPRPIIIIFFLLLAVSDGFCSHCQSVVGHLTEDTEGYGGRQACVWMLVVVWGLVCVCVLGVLWTQNEFCLFVFCV